LPCTEFDAGLDSQEVPLGRCHSWRGMPQRGPNSYGGPRGKADQGRMATNHATVCQKRPLFAYEIMPKKNCSNSLPRADLAAQDSLQPEEPGRPSALSKDRKLPSSSLASSFPPKIQAAIQRPPPCVVTANEHKATSQPGGDAVSSGLAFPHLHLLMLNFPSVGTRLHPLAALLRAMATSARVGRLAVPDEAEKSGKSFKFFKNLRSARRLQPRNWPVG
jgi:hypothetical protein